MIDRPVVELWSLRIFVEVATTRSMTLAATRLGITQSAVSQAIRKLESELDNKLIVRGSRPVALTAEGALLELEAEPLLRNAARLPELLRSAKTGPVRDVRLGFVDTFASTAGPELIRTLTQQAARVVVWSGLAPSLGAALVARDVDAIVTSDPLYDLDGLRRIALWKEPFVLLLPRTSEARAARPSLDQLAAASPLIRYSARSHSGSQIERHLRRLGISTERRIEVDGSDALLAMVAAGIGWAITTPLCILQASAHLPGVLPLPLPPPGFNRTLSLVVRDDSSASLAEQLASAARDVLRESCLPRLRRLTPAFTASITVGDAATHHSETP